jgi:prevent-host-death family protein
MRCGECNPKVGNLPGIANDAVFVVIILTPGDVMYRVTEGATIATVTDLRRRTSEVMQQAEEGSVVVVQKDNEPQGVYLSYRRYQAILERLDKLESLELAEIAVARKEAVDRGEMGTTSLEDMIAEFAPELRSRGRTGA